MWLCATTRPCQIDYVNKISSKKFANLNVFLFLSLVITENLTLRWTMTILHPGTQT